MQAIEQLGGSGSCFPGLLSWELLSSKPGPSILIWTPERRWTLQNVNSYCFVWSWHFITRICDKAPKREMSTTYSDFPEENACTHSHVCVQTDRQTCRQTHRQTHYEVRAIPFLFQFPHCYIAIKMSSVYHHCHMYHTLNCHDIILYSKGIQVSIICQNQTLL